jgi:RNA polymerase sigma-70 factor (ECF subfamily)
MHDSPPIDWRTALGEHERWLRNVVAGRLGAADGVEDVLQEVALAVLRNPAQPDDPRKVAPWLFRLAVRHAVNFLRTRQRRRRLVEGLSREPSVRQGGIDPMEWVLDVERREAVRAALEALPAEDREVLRLKYLDGLRYRELAERLGLDLEAVEYRLLRARRRLREQLHDLAEPD